MDWGPTHPGSPSVLTAEGQQASIGDRRLAQVQHLEHGEVFRQEAQAGVSKLWGTEPLSPGDQLWPPKAAQEITPRLGQLWREVTGTEPSSEAHSPPSLGVWAVLTFLQRLKCLF